jgi:5-methyltetrahydrofolate--homocysteine methyltransferase
MWSLLDITNKTGIVLTETYAMLPASSVSGLYFAHPKCQYFALGKIGKDQIASYCTRKNMDMRDVERWLSQSLGYEPEEE